MTTEDDPALAASGLEEVVGEEVRFINARRRKLGREPLSFAGIGPSASALDAVGLALSGGGIRSASFALGILQAFNEHRVLENIDYLSTVSGGGYIGTALSASMTLAGEFVFGQSTGPREPDARPADVKDTAAVGHLRNYSNYLVPFGARDVVTAAAIIVRGLVANVALVLPLVLVFAAVTIGSNPTRDELLKTDLFGWDLDWNLPVIYFGLTLLLALAAFPVFLAWAIYRSYAPAGKQAEFGTLLPTLGASALVVIALSGFFELQPFMLAGMFDLADEARSSGHSGYSLLAAMLQGLAAIATPVAAAVTLFRQQVGTLLKSVTAASGLMAQLAAFAMRAAIWVAGAAVPLLIWVGFLYLCYWGIAWTAVPAEPSRELSAFQGTLQFEGPGIKLRGDVDCRRLEGRSECAPLAEPAPATVVNPTGHTPNWLLGAARLLAGWIPSPYRIAGFYVIVAAVLFGISFWLRPNANSLHRLYRDRLSKAFLFDPRRYEGRRTLGTEREFARLDSMRLSDLADPDKPHAPYHLINAALTVQGSSYANRRGRNADFFLFSPLFVGSEATRYCRTEAMELASGLDLATAMAVSGAAFSSNMGRKSIRALTPTLALLNVRTGYWLENPRFIAPAPPGQAAASRRKYRSKWYLWSEISGRLSEDSDEVYLTDGGHIENLGIYELLRRRCRFIVAVDTEADPVMRFASLISLQRYARIDLGVRITMPWDAVRSSTLAWMGLGATQASAPKSSHGPHAAIGTIDYDGGATGFLLYIKASLTGDENDYVRDYARRFEQFPHESTGDQFFSEEQFETYRALGFHIAIRLLNGEDRLQVPGATTKMNLHSNHPTINPMRDALLSRTPNI